MRSRLIKALNNRFFVKFMQFEIGLLLLIDYYKLNLHFDSLHDIIMCLHLLRIHMMSIFVLSTNLLHLLTTIYFCCTYHSLFGSNS